MIDRIFSAALTFCLLIGGTLAVGSALFGLDQPAHKTAQVRIVQLEPVVITARRFVPASAVATVDHEPAAQRVQ